MHLHTEVVVEASTQDEARKRAEALLRKHKYALGWDWYQIGGRWRGIHTGRVRRAGDRHPTEWDEHPFDILEADLVNPDGARTAALVVTEEGVEGQEAWDPIPFPNDPGTFLVTVDIHV